MKWKIFKYEMEDFDGNNNHNRYPSYNNHNKLAVILKPNKTIRILLQVEGSKSENSM